MKGGNYRIARANREAIQKEVPTLNKGRGLPKNKKTQRKKTTIKNKKNSMKGVGGHEKHDKKSNGKSAAGAVSFYKTHRLHHFPRQCSFEQDKHGNGKR